MVLRISVRITESLLALTSNRCKCELLTTAFRGTQFLRHPCAWWPRGFKPKFTDSAPYLSVETEAYFSVHIAQRGPPYMSVRSLHSM